MRKIVDDTDDINRHHIAIHFRLLSLYRILLCFTCKMTVTLIRRFVRSQHKHDIQGKDTVNKFK
jgi:hypothetical protein